MAIDKELFKQALGAWASGVTIVTTRNESDVFGMTASAFSSVSMEPPLVLVCINKSANTCPVIPQAGFFAVNILEAGQEEKSNQFASWKHRDSRWQDLAHHKGSTGAPLLDESLASLDCRLANSVEAGSHILYIGEVVHAEINSGTPLMYYKGAYRGFAGLD